MSKLFGFFEMDYVARVHQVKGAMALDDFLSLPTQIPEFRRGIRKREYFGAHGL